MPVRKRRGSSRQTQRPVEMVPSITGSANPLSQNAAEVAQAQVSFFNRPNPQVLAQCQNIVRQNEQFEQYMLQQQKRALGLTSGNKTKAKGARRSLRKRQEEAEGLQAATSYGQMAGMLLGNLAPAAVASTGYLPYVGGALSSGMAPYVAGMLAATYGAKKARNLYKWYYGI